MTTLHQILSLAASAALLAACGGTVNEEESSESSALTAEARVCPGATIVHGIDVSEFQGTIKWASVKSAGKDFAVIRVSDGTGHLDPFFASNWKNAKAAGVAVGAYQFFRPEEDPTVQADLMLSHLSSVGYGAGDLPPVLDVEVTDGVSSATIAARVNTWLQHVKAKTGRLPSVYTSPGYWGGIGNPTPSPLPYLWVANWGVSCPTLPPAWGRLRIWQYSDSGSVSGISGAVDLDEYNGPLSELKSL
jgi:lysozyme